MVEKEKSLADILKEEETTVAGVLYSYLSSNSDNKLDKNIVGLQEVKENIKKALFKAKFSAGLGYVPILVLTGPAGSGKTEIINALVDSYYEAVSKAGGIYALSTNGTRCVYKENPYNVLRLKTLLRPEDFGINKKTISKRRPTICDLCAEAINTAVEGHKDLHKLLGVERFLPDISSNIELGDKRLQERLYQILSKANRGILILSADKSSIENIPEIYYQLLINLYDNMLSDKNGGNVPLDMLIIVHGNENFINNTTDYIDSDETGKQDPSRPLKERMLQVQVRRVLSYSEEEKLYKMINLPFRNMAKNSLKYLSTFSILSRIMWQEDYSDINYMHYVLDALDIYDSGRLGSMDFSTIPKGLSDYLAKASKDKRRVKDTVLSFMIDGDSYISGWSEGMSFRNITSLLKDSEKSDLKYTDIFSFINSNKKVFDDDDRFQSTKEYIIKMVLSDINADMDSALFSFFAQKNSVDYQTIISAFEKRLDHMLVEEKELKLSSEESNAITKLAEYVNLDSLEQYAQSYKDDKAISSEKFSIKLDPMLRYTYFRFDDEFEAFVKKDAEILKTLADKRSELYSYVSDFLKKNYGYWDDLTEEAVNIYREGPERYPEIVTDG